MASNSVLLVTLINYSKEINPFLHTLVFRLRPVIHVLLVLLRRITVSAATTSTSLLNITASSISRVSLMIIVPRPLKCDAVASVQALSLSPRFPLSHFINAASSLNCNVFFFLNGVAEKNLSCADIPTTLQIPGHPSRLQLSGIIIHLGDTPSSGHCIFCEVLGTLNNHIVFDNNIIQTNRLSIEDIQRNAYLLLYCEQKDDSHYAGPQDDVDKKHIQALTKEEIISCHTWHSGLNLHLRNLEALAPLIDINNKVVQSTPTLVILSANITSWYTGWARLLGTYLNKPAQSVIFAVQEVRLSRRSILTATSTLRQQRLYSIFAENSSRVNPKNPFAAPPGGVGIISSLPIVEIPWNDPRCKLRATQGRLIHGLVYPTKDCPLHIISYYAQTGGTTSNLIRSETNLDLQCILAECTAFGAVPVFLCSDLNMEPEQSTTITTATANGSWHDLAVRFSASSVGGGYPPPLAGSLLILVGTALTLF